MPRKDILSGLTLEYSRFYKKRDAEVLTEREYLTVDCSGVKQKHLFRNNEDNEVRFGKIIKSFIIVKTT